MLGISKKLFASWNDAGLLYCHWKSNEHLLPGLEGDTDLDVLLSHNDKDQGETILRSLDFLQCKSQFGSRYPNVDDWIGFDKITGKLIHLHLHYELVTGHKGMKEYTLPWEEEALRTRVYNDEYGVFIMEPNLELVTLFTRIGLKANFINLFRCRLRRFHFPKDIKREINWLNERVDMAKVRQLLDSYYGNKAGAVFSLMQKGKITASDYLQLWKIAELTFRKNRNIRYFVRIREIAFFVYSTCLKRLIKRISPVMTRKVPVSQKGLTVAFLGQDGAGKTTVTKQLIKWWHWKLDVRYVYLGSGENYFSLKKRLMKAIPPKGAFKSFRAILGLSVLKDVAKKSYRNVVKAEKYAAKGGLVIYDRYPQTGFTGICDGPKIRKKIQDIFGNGFVARLFAPMAKKEEKYIKKTVSHNPDVVFKLILSPEESIRRKPQEKYEVVRQKHEIIKTLKFDNSDVYTIDATMPYEEEMVLIKNVIWQHIHK